MRAYLITILFTFVAVSTNVYSQDDKDTKAATTPTPTPEVVVKTTVEVPPLDTKVTVYFYRFNQFVGWALQPPVFCDEFRVGKIENGQFFTVRLEPGKHTFHSDDKQSGMEIDLKTGEDYYIRVDLAPGFWYGHGRMTLMQKEQGTYEIKKLKPMDAKKIKEPAAKKDKPKP